MSLFVSSLEQFHFIRPEWLLALPTVFLLWWLLSKQSSAQRWSSYIPKEMLVALQVSSTKQSSAWKWSLLSVFVATIIAAAGPTWDRQATPTIQNQKALVVALDLSPSMLVQDLSPDRLTRAKYKLIDILRQFTDGQAALIAYAGDAHTVSPLTDDPRTIQALLPALHPNVMPSQGSNTEAALELAQQLLSDAGLSSGDILIISDGVASDAIDNINGTIKANYRVSILAVGGADAAPIPSATGGYIRNANGEIVLSSVNSAQLRSMAASLGGRFSMLTADDSDIERLLSKDFEAGDTSASLQSSAVYDAWVDMGHWLILLMLPFALALFRKGVIYLIPIFSSALLLTPDNSYAADTSWRNLWQTPDQQALQQYQEGDYENAANTFKRKDWSAIANYRNGSYAQAISDLSELDDIDSLYNKGNALAYDGQLEEAIKAYKEVLEQDASHQDAAHNKSVIEQLLQQQEKSQQQNQDSKGSSNNSPEENKDQNSQSQEQEQEQEQDSNSQDQAPQKNQDQNSSPQNSQQQSESEQTGQEQSNSEQEKEESSNEQPSTAQREENQDEEADNEEKPLNVNQAKVENTDQPLKDSSEQWLRTIQDDPSGLLRRKFDYQARQRAQQGKQKTQDTAAQERY